MRLTTLALAALLPLPLLAQNVPDLLYAPQDDWPSVQGGGNYSAYVFRDRNLSGRYDLGDNPLPGIYVALGRDGVGRHLASANANGFANFYTSASKEEAVIDAPGIYSFEVVVPPGWGVTTGNKVQEIELVANPDGSTGFYLAESLKPVGLAPVLSVSGTYGGAAAATLTLTRDGAEISRAEVAPGERFTLPARIGNVEVSDGAHTVTIDVGVNPVELGTFDGRDRAGAAEERLTFEELEGYRLYKLPNGYGGLDWTDINGIHRNTTPGSVGYVNGLTSGHHTGYITNGRPGEISRPEGFDVISVELSMAWQEAEGAVALIEAWRGEDRLVADRVPLSALTPKTYAPQLKGVTRLRITPQNQWQGVMDDLRYSLN